MKEIIEVKRIIAIAQVVQEIIGQEDSSYCQGCAGDKRRQEDSSHRPGNAGDNRGQEDSSQSPVSAGDNRG